MDRPELTSTLPSDEFLAWYWLKEELVGFCQKKSLPCAGNKADIEAVIVAHLAHLNALPKRAPRRAKGEMPNVFSKEDLIGKGWSCNVALGAFFRKHLGNDFRFNKAMRDFIHNGEGKTLGQAMACYQESVRPDRPQSVIAPSLEYNRHTRDFFAANPNATRAMAIAAWWEKRKKRKT